MEEDRGNRENYIDNEVIGIVLDLALSNELMGFTILLRINMGMTQKIMPYQLLEM